MKKFFSFFSKLAAFITFSGVVLYCIAYFFASKTHRINELLSKKTASLEDDGE